MGITRLQKLKAELREVETDIKRLVQRHRSYETTEMNALIKRRRNLQININQEKQK